MSKPIRSLRIRSSRALKSASSRARFLPRSLLPYDGTITTRPCADFCRAACVECARPTLGNWKFPSDRNVFYSHKGRSGRRLRRDNVFRPRPRSTRRFGVDRSASFVFGRPRLRYIVRVHAHVYNAVILVLYICVRNTISYVSQEFSSNA